MLKDKIAAMAELLTGTNFLKISCPRYNNIYFFNLTTMQRIPNVSAASQSLNCKGYDLDFKIAMSDGSIEEASLHIDGDLYSLTVKELTNEEGALKIAQAVATRIAKL